MAHTFDREGSQLKAPMGFKYDNLGRVIIIARAHDTLVAGTPYQINADEYGWFTAAIAANEYSYRIGIAKKAYVGDEIGEFVHGGQYSGMISSTSLSLALGHTAIITAGAVADGGADWTSLDTTAFALCYTASVESLTHDVIMIPEKITATS